MQFPRTKAQRQQSAYGTEISLVFASLREKLLSRDAFVQCSGLMSFLSTMLSLGRSILMPNFLSLR